MHLAVGVTKQLVRKRIQMVKKNQILCVDHCTTYSSYDWNRKDFF